jgi:hypothetical protein
LPECLKNHARNPEASAKKTGAVDSAGFSDFVLGLPALDATDFGTFSCVLALGHQKIDDRRITAAALANFTSAKAYLTAL